MKKKALSLVPEKWSNTRYRLSTINICLKKYQIRLKLGLTFRGGKLLNLLLKIFLERI